MGKKKFQHGVEPPSPEPTAAERRAELARRLMQSRIQEADRLAETFEATRDPRELAS